MKSLIYIFAALICFSKYAHAGCDNMSAPHAIKGKAYVAGSESELPKKLIFNLDGSASYGSALDGHPGGTFWVQGLCNEQFAVIFKPSLGPDMTEKIIFILKATDKSYKVLVETHQGLVFTLENENE